MEVAELRTTHHSRDRGSGRAFRYHRRRLANAIAVAAADSVALVCAMLLGGAVRWWLFGQALIPEWTWLFVMAWWGVAYAAGLLPTWGLGIVTELRRTVMLLLALFGGTALILFLAKQGADMSRLTVSIGFIASIPLVPIGRMLIKNALIRADYWGNPVVVYGSGGTSGRVIRALRKEPGLGYFPVGVFDDRADLWGDYVEGVRVLGSLEQSAPAAPVAVLVGSGIPPDRVAELLEGPLSCYKQTVVIPDLFDMPSLWVKSRNLAGILGLEITSNLLDPLSKFLKRSMDLLIVLCTAPFWGPTYLLVAGLIRLDGGGSPLFFQERAGKDGRTFKMPKFRTMHRDADDLLEGILEEDAELRAEWLASFKLRRDPRITRLGSFLRTWSLDELPQLITVLRGDMSLVGPRPLPHYHLIKLQPHTQKLRTRVRPGMTGQWQVSGRSDAGSLTMERWDAFYVRNWSVWLDMVILVRTFSTVIRGAGAY